MEWKEGSKIFCPYIITFSGAFISWVICLLCTFSSAKQTIPCCNSNYVIYISPLECDSAMGRIMWFISSLLYLLFNWIQYFYASLVFQWNFMPHQLQQNFQNEWVHYFSYLCYLNCVVPETLSQILQIDIDAQMVRSISFLPIISLMTNFTDSLVVLSISIVHFR